MNIAPISHIGPIRLMLRKIFILFLVFYILTLLQDSFFVHFTILGQVPNLVLIVFFLLLFRNSSNTVIQPEIIFAGVLFDVFSCRIIGVSIACLLVGSILIKRILTNLKRTNILVFLLLFLVFQVLYYFSLSTFDFFLEKSAFLKLDRFLLAQIGYNSIFAVFGFWLFQLLRSRARIYTN